MNQLQKIANALRRLNDLEAMPEAEWARELSPSERAFAIRHFRDALPLSILVHHGSHIAQGRRSLAVVVEDTCGNCGSQLPASVRNRRVARDSLDICEVCGVFLEHPASGKPSPIARTASRHRVGGESPPQVKS